MEEDKDINEKFEELVRKAEDESNKLQKKYDFTLLVIEMILQLVGLTIICVKLGWLIGLGLFMWTMGNNLQNGRNAKKK
jgi:hypothetical protein